MSPVVKAEIERLIVNWGYWKSGGGAVAGGITLGIGAGDSWGEPRMPLLFGEARITDQALERLYEPQRLVLQAHYLTNLRRAGAGSADVSSRDGQDTGAQWLGDQARMKSEKLGLSRPTFYRLLANSQKTFWLAYQLFKLPRIDAKQETLDIVRRIRIISATVV